MSDHLTVVLAGSSMSPTLDIGDVLEVVPVRRRIAKGEIILIDAAAEGMRVCHRVRRVVRVLGRTWYVHRGDAEGAEADVVRANRVVGVVVAARRLGRGLPLTNSTPARDDFDVLRALLRFIAASSRRRGSSLMRASFRLVRPGPGTAADRAPSEGGRR